MRYTFEKAEPGALSIAAHRRRLALGAGCVLLIGFVLGLLWTGEFFPRSSPPADFSIPQLLQSAHRLLDEGQLDRAEKSYHSVLGRDPGNPEALTHLGNIAARRGDVDGALRYYDEALSRDPEYLHALWDKGLALRDRRDDRGAIDAWAAFLRLVPPDTRDAGTLEKWIAEARGRLERRTTEAIR